MATDFFQRQSEARRSTTWLVSMFLLAVVSIVAVVVVVTSVVMQTQLKGESLDFSQHPEQWMVPAIAGIITLVIISGGTLFKVFDLQSGGGTRVAESLGGRRIYPNTADAVEKRLLNVVEEMALASGTPVPPVFMLPEEGINAFAAGYSPSDAVLGVTRGCAEQLTRDELQGVIAHEFSHVLNGDMRMSIRLIGVLHGILLIGLVGQLIFRMFLYSGGSRRRSNNSNGNSGGGQAILVIMAIGVALLILGFVGTFFGNLIKAAVSRQREYLADASAVQFTRNPAGISGALKRIGGYAAGSQLKAASAAEASHMYFSQGVWEGFSGLWATHPPLEKRIRAIEPNWDGKLVSEARSSTSGLGAAAAGFAGTPTAASSTGSPAAQPAAQQTAGPSASPRTEVPIDIVDHAVEHVGEPNEGHRHYASELIAGLPPVILDAVHEPYSARALVYCLLMDTDRGIRKKQIEILHANAPIDLVREVAKLIKIVDQLDVRTRLPLVDMALSSLRSMCRSQYDEFRVCFVKLAEADSRIDLFEWTLSQVLMRHLQPQFEKMRAPGIQYYSIQQLGEPISKLLSVVAAAGNDEATAQLSFARGASHLPELQLQQFPATNKSFDDLRAALSVLVTVVARERGRIVDACAASICADNNVTWQEAELLRGISDLLDCPMPPLLVR